MSKTKKIITIPSDMSNSPPLHIEKKYVDLFCGLGSFHTAFDRHNRSTNTSIQYKCVFACDIDKKIQKIYKENYGLIPMGDIHSISVEEIPDFDILCAGFPCQPFSIAGKKQGFEDPKKGNLFLKLLEIIDKKQPKTIILENVKNLCSLRDGKTFEIVKEELEKRGYLVNYKIIDSRYYHCPQSRQRLFIVADQEKMFQFREIQNAIVPVSSIIDYSVSSFFDYEEKYRLEECTSKNGRMKYKLIHKKTGKGGRQGERVYDIQKCGPTICASSGGPGAKTGLYDIDGRMRTLTVQETLKMFGFDTTFKYQSTSENEMLFYLGNSIVVNVLEELIKDL